MKDRAPIYDQKVIKKCDALGNLIGFNEGTVLGRDRKGIFLSLSSKKDRKGSKL